MSEKLVSGQGFKNGGFEFICIGDKKYPASQIAAFPKLLAACESALHAIGQYPNREHPMTASELIMRDAVRDATK